MNKKTTNTKKVVSTPVLVLAQWLSYVFWALGIVAIAFLTASIVGFYSNSSMLPAETVAYGVVAILILIPLALVADIFFGKHEDERKTVANSVVMVIHAVLFALVAIGALVATAFFVVSPILSTTPTPTTAVDITTAAVVFVLFVALLVRVTKPGLHRLLRAGFRIDMVLVALVALGFAIAGPLSYAVTTKNDRLTRDAVMYVSNTLSTYVSQGNDLPESIDVNLGVGDAMTSYIYGQEALHAEAVRLQKEGVITYTPNVLPVETLKDEFTTGNKNVYYYELCANFQHALRKDAIMTYPVATDSKGYAEYLTIDSVDAGKQCYKLKTIRYLAS